MDFYNELSRIVFNTLENLYGDKIPENIIERINHELDNLLDNNQSRLLLDIINMNDYLNDKYKNEFIFIGTISEWYISYLLGVTKVNPLNIDFHKNIKVNLLLKEGIMDEVVNYLNEYFNNTIKVTSNISKEDLPFYHYLVIDHDNKLSTYDGSKIRPTMPLKTKAKKKDLEDKYEIIGISEYMNLKIISELNNLDIDYPEFNIDNIKAIKKFSLECNTLHKTRFEILLAQYDNIEEMFFDNFKLIEKWRIEFLITWVKYNCSLTYYNVVIKYFNNQVNKNLELNKIKKYMNNYKSALNYYETKGELKGEDYYPYAFFKIVSDIINIFDKDFKFEIINNEIIPIFYNITFFESIPLNGKMEVLNSLLLDCINNNRITSLYICGGPSNWYLCNLIGYDTKLDRKVIETYLNPLKSSRYILDKEPLETIDEKNFFKSINKLRNSCLLMYNYYEMNVEDNLDYLIETIDESSVVIIDDLSIFMLDTSYTLSEVLNTLNKLNRRIYIFDNLNEDLVRNHGIKRTYSKYIYTINKNNNKIEIESVTSLKDKYIIND